MAAQRLVAATDGARPHRGFRARPGSVETVDRAFAAYALEHGDRPCSPLTIVIAALDEASNLPAVLAEIPAEIGGFTVDVLVVDDGSTDTTASVAAAGGALVLRLDTNLGHGTALRAGYRLAGDRGATMIATLDADGQWDPGDLPAMVDIIASDQADMVVGSRVLGRTENVETLRNAGVHVFGRLARLLTGTGVTDTSSGLRLMRVPVLTSVRQVQPQYQTSELLVGASVAGWRIAEVPTVMRRRMSGESKKGHNALYGLRYARVLIGTWLRESCLAPLPGSPRAVIPGLRPPTASRLLRFALTSLLCLVVSEIVLLGLVEAGWHGWTASLAASAAGVVPGYPLQRAWTFSRRGPSRFKTELLPYIIASLGSAALAAVGTGVVDAFLRGRTSDATRTRLDALAYLLCYGAAWLVRFTVLDRVLFKSSSANDPAVAPYTHNPDSPAPTTATPAVASWSVS